MSQHITKRSHLYQSRLRAQLLEALELPAPRRVTCLRRVARQCVHLGCRELAREARHLARAGGAA